MAKLKYADWPEERKARKRKRDKKSIAKCKAANPEKYKKLHRDWYLANREHVLKRTAKWKENNPEQYIKNQVEWRANNAERIKKVIRANHIKSSYGLTVAEYDAMVVAQNNRCAICNTDKPGGKSKHWHIDHCHKTKAIRLLLCNSCNTGLGHFKHNITILQYAIDYLKKFS